MVRFSRRLAVAPWVMAITVAFGLSGACAQTWGAPGLCSVMIQSAGSAGVVMQSDQIGGVSTLPSYASLWVFTQAKGANQWWPQGGGEARVFMGGSWSVHATFGLPQEVGKDFRVAAVPVDSATDVRLAEWVQRGNTTGYYPGIALPKPAYGCTSATVTVHRVQ